MITGYLQGILNIQHMSRRPSPPVVADDMLCSICAELGISDFLSYGIAQFDFHSCANKNMNPKPLGIT